MTPHTHLHLSITHGHRHPPYYGQEQYASNGQYFGGWAPPFRPPYAPGGPFPPQPAPPGQYQPNMPPQPPPVQPEQQLTQTATIRNAVNLKKHTKADAGAGRPDQAGHPVHVRYFVPLLRVHIYVSHAVLDLSRYDWAELSKANGDTYPLVVRLETITEKGLAEGHTLQELQPGGEQKLWVQSQTTFATLVKDEDGSYLGRGLKQKIWVEGVSYELQEIYG
ncbi:hypothetical protein WJX72_002200, partial [[Myrmecia] bisecta]